MWFEHRILLLFFLVCPGSASLLNDVYCYFCKCECCNSDWISADINGLHEALRTRLHGQHLVIDTVLAAIKAHRNNPSPSKALVLSFHGDTGVGKNFVSDIIAEFLYRKGVESSYFHRYIPEIDFPNADEVQTYKDKLRKEIKSSVSQCQHSLFMFDEVDKMHLGIIDALAPFLGNQNTIDGIDYRKSIFILLSTTGSQDINKYALKNHQDGVQRQYIGLTEMEEIIRKSASETDGGLRYNKLISHYLIDHLVPFLPLQRQHVHECIKDELLKRGKEATKLNIEKVANMLQYYPRDRDQKVFSSSGCKQVKSKVGLLSEGHSEL